MTAITEVKQPNFLMMKRVWIAIALPIVIFYFSGIQGLVQLAIVWIFASIMLLMFAYKNSASKSGMPAPEMYSESLTACGVTSSDLLL